MRQVGLKGLEGDWHLPSKISLLDDFPEPLVAVISLETRISTLRNI